LLHSHFFYVQQIFSVETMWEGISKTRVHFI